jgi:uncharacterized alkaline shock family protein YloU
VSDYPAEARAEYAAESRPPSGPPPFGPRPDETLPERGDPAPPGPAGGLPPDLERPIDRPLERPADRPDRPMDRGLDRPLERSLDRPAPVERPMDRPGSVSVSGGGAERERERDRQRLAAVVKGRIDVADEVVEKVAGLAAMEVPGVADLGGDMARALESVRERIGIGQKRGDQGIKARIQGREVAVDVVIVVEYGHVVMEVARRVQANVASQTNRMLGLAVVEVNVIVDDVRMPRPPEAEDGDEAGEYGRGLPEGYGA